MSDDFRSRHGKKAAIQFAKRNRWIWFRVRHLPVREFDLTSDEDLVDTVINGEEIEFSYDKIPLDKKKKYMTNLDNYELRISNLIQRLESEYAKLKAYNDKVNAILETIANSNPLNIQPISELPEFDCISLDVILPEEKKKYDEQISKKSEEKAPPKTIDEVYPWLKDVDQQQRANLTRDKKTAIMLYKSFMYNLFNNIISYVRSNGLNINEIANDEYVESLIMEEYNKYVEKLKKPKIRMFGSSNVEAASTVVDRLFPDNYDVGYNKFRQIVLDNVGLLEPSLSSTVLTQPLTVYRCVYEPINKSIYNGDLGNALLSTTTSSVVVSDFMEKRKYDIKFDSKKVIYKIELPAGSPVIAFTNDVYLEHGASAAGFGEDQQEILLDSQAYDFEYVDSDFNTMRDGTTLYSVVLSAVPKQERSMSR